ncbi:tRNA pseudouridine(55) synthase TruB [Corynebacterium uberis]|uniref:tRNA pseudouridine(55) synthase TruB n=1 Tax=Corynebacterium TaxID=1716 RepID=UPI001D0B073D|nr:MULTISPECIES: tRNA pseudouridine(55) synthase TruB [Corynebacterium]MCZ9308459.1 tRNA pseudouridine(55) synthase TruB [Corynebacterium sp. c6VSa_13]UDL74123.1 tRNA pseudouridine(55) synthase TruB [Corynebacterium uberis]UDL74993.1 tRNA pseudouridine(55) synthase TruB [Corynebacterium uberis]UDL77208.1 tRNA pseudouridine(55) synthase TruB [Corynebacterium uberis]UDL79490.1 tRNA pseudouridine(55) synthase TruB [Corynebacterium uberis]
MTDPLSGSGLVIVDKPSGMTSHDVVGRLRRAFGTKKVGHAGTLDPLATGVLVMGIGRGTRFLAHLVATTKSYDATMRLGATSTTDDAEGTITPTASPQALSLLDDAALARATTSLTGDIMQRPTRVSAIKIDGKRAHQRARDGEDFDIPARPVTVTRFDILGIRRADDHIDLDVSVDCSSGTYIRALARDLGEALGVGGHITALRRTAVGPFHIDDAHPLDQIESTPELSLTLDEALLACYPRLDVTAEEYQALALGKWLEPRGLAGTHAAVGPDGRVVALVAEEGKRLRTVFVARPATLG